MSDQYYDANSAVPQRMGKLHHFAPARYGKLLFGQGQAGWQQNKAGQYLRYIEAPLEKFFTREEFDNCLELLRGEFGIKDFRADFSPLYMSFCIDAKDMAWLREYGLGKTDAGTILTFDAPVMADDAGVSTHNNPLKVLKENLRLAVHEQANWKDTLKHRLLSGDQRECNIYLSNTFLQQLAEVLPQQHGLDYEVKECVRDIIPTLLPHIPVTVALTVDDDKPFKMITLAVKPEHYAALEEAIMEAKQTPRTSVTSIVPATIGKREAGQAR